VMKSRLQLAAETSASAGANIDPRGTSPYPSRFHASHYFSHSVKLLSFTRRFEAYTAELEAIDMIQHQAPSDKHIYDKPFISRVIDFDEPPIYRPSPRLHPIAVASPVNVSLSVVQVGLTTAAQCLCR
jgi:hypothetical protein